MPGGVPHPPDAYWSKGLGEPDPHPLGVKMSPKSGPRYHVLRRGSRSKQRHKRAPATTFETAVRRAPAFKASP
jgi:hypothetical protein